MTTNYEKIKAMSIDEMAKILSYDCANRCPKYLQFKKCYGNCQENVKQWLEQENEEENERKRN